MCKASRTEIYKAGKFYRRSIVRGIRSIDIQRCNQPP